MQELFIHQVEANKGIIVKISRSFCRNKADQDDLCQEILFRLWKALPKYDPAYVFTTWMYKVALNVAISYYRNAKKSPGTIPFVETHSEATAAEDGFDNADSPQYLLQKHVATKVSRIKEKLKQAILNDKKLMYGKS